MNWILAVGIDQGRMFKPGWREVLRRWGIDTALLPRGSASAEALIADPGFALLYQDRTAALLRQSRSGLPSVSEGGGALRNNPSPRISPVQPGGV